MSWDEMIHGWNGDVRARDRLAGVDQAANETRAEVCRHEDPCGDGTSGGLYERICWIDNKTRNIWGQQVQIDDNADHKMWPQVSLYWTHQWTDAARAAQTIEKVNQITEQLADIQKRLTALENGGVDTTDVAKQVSDAVQTALKGLTIKIGS